jgi:hypothetical protein
MILYTDISNEVVMYELYVYRVFQNRSAMHWGRGDSGGNWDKNVNKTRCAEFPKLMSVVTPSLNHTVLFSLRTTFAQEPGSSGSVVSDYGLDDRVIGVRSPAGAKDFSSSLCVQTGSGAHPASSTNGTGGPFPGGKARPGRDADHSPPSSAEVVNE